MDNPNRIDADEEVILHARLWLLEGDADFHDDLCNCPDCKGDWPIWPNCYCRELDGVTYAPSDYHPTVVEQQWAAQEFGKDGHRPLDLGPAEAENMAEMSELAKWLYGAAPPDYTVPPRLNGVRLEDK